MNHPSNHRPKHNNSLSSVCYSRLKQILATLNCLAFWCLKSFRVTLKHWDAFITLICLSIRKPLRHLKNWEATHQPMHTFTSSNQSIHGLNDFLHYFWLIEHLQSRSHISHILLTIQPATSFSVSFLWSQYSKKLFLNHWDNELTLLQINDWQAKSLHWEAFVHQALLNCWMYTVQTSLFVENSGERVLLWHT